VHIRQGGSTGDRVTDATVYAVWPYHAPAHTTPGTPDQTPKAAYGRDIAGEESVFSEVRMAADQRTTDLLQMAR